MLPLQILLSLSALHYLLYFVPASAAASTNFTIDDTFGDSATGLSPTYSTNWNVGQTCSGCAVVPDASKTFMGTWHDTTTNSPMKPAPHQVNLTFQGMSGARPSFR